MGLLDFIGKKFATGEGLTDEDRRAAARQGLLQLGATLLSTPSNGSQGFGKGLLAGVQGVQDAGAGAVNDRYRKQIMDRTTAGAERNTAIEAAQMGLIGPDGQLDEAKWVQYANLDPKGAMDLRQAMSKPQGQAPTIKDFYEGSELVQKQWDGQQWVDPTFGGTSQAPQMAPAGADPQSIRSSYQDLASQFPGTQITSLLRTKQHNADVGGVPNSQHVRGTAGDFVVPDQDKPAFIAKAKAQGFEAIDEGDHIHLELPPGGVKPFPKSGGLGRGNRYKDGDAAPKESYATLSADDVAALGLPPGTVAQRSPTGQIQVVSKPEAASQKSAEAQAQRAMDAQGTLDLLADAEDLVKKSTGSGLGAARDATAGFFGLSTEGANAIASLQTIAGQLTSKMPRMQGPQSDKDVQLYKQMAGDLANPNVPIPQRLAALGTIRSLNQKYAGDQSDAPAVSPAPKTIPISPAVSGAKPKRLKFNPATGMLE